jgi:hypothetical protein
MDEVEKKKGRGKSLRTRLMDLISSQDTSPVTAEKIKTLRMLEAREYKRKNDAEKQQLVADKQVLNKQVAAQTSEIDGLKKKLANPTVIKVPDPELTEQFQKEYDRLKGENERQRRELASFTNVVEAICKNIPKDERPRYMTDVCRLASGEGAKAFLEMIQTVPAPEPREKPAVTTSADAIDFEQRRREAMRPIPPSLDYRSDWLRKRA